MPSKIYQNLFNEKAENFKAAFIDYSRAYFAESDTSKKLFHSGEFGIYREKICREFFRFFIPQRLEIGSGFVIDSFGNHSFQCDIVVYDKENSPILQSDTLASFFPIESVVAVGEIKSTLSKKKLSEALIKLKQIKEMREKCGDVGFIYQPPERMGRDQLPQSKFGNYPEFNPRILPSDQIITFVLAETFEFEFPPVSDSPLGLIAELYGEEINAHPSLFHNLVLSLNNGALAFQIARDSHEDPITYSAYPFHPLQKIIPLIATANRGKNGHLQLLGHLLMQTSEKVILPIEFGSYLGPLGVSF
jgi:hypothetical protein